MGRIWFAKLGSTALIRRKQLEIADQEKGLDLVVLMIRQKIENQINFLKKLKYSRPGKEAQFEDSINIISSAISALDTNDKSIEEARHRIMGVEGAAGRAYFQCISNLLPEKYRFKGRSR